MTENKLIHLSDGEKGWLIIGIGLGVILTFVILYLYTYLPLISPTQQSVLVGFICGCVIQDAKMNEEYNERCRYR